MSNRVVAGFTTRYIDQSHIFSCSDVKRTVTTRPSTRCVGGDPIGATRRRGAYRNRIPLPVRPSLWPRIGSNNSSCRESSRSTSMCQGWGECTESLSHPQYSSPSSLAPCTPPGPMSLAAAAHGPLNPSRFLTPASCVRRESDDQDRA